MTLTIKQKMHTSEIRVKMFGNGQICSILIGRYVIAVFIKPVVLKINALVCIERAGQNE